MSTTEKPLEELVAELSPQRRSLAREFVEHLLGLPARPQAPETPEPGPDAEVSLREITAETVRDICSLSDTLEPPKKYMVAPNAVSIAQAYFEPKAWFRAIYAADTPVGFIMLYDDPDEPEYFLWRFMIAGHLHCKGFGRQAIELLADYVRTRPGGTVLQVSCVEGPGSPEGFYRKVGFRRSGKMFGVEVGMILDLA